MEVEDIKPSCVEGRHFPRTNNDRTVKTASSGSPSEVFQPLDRIIIIICRMKSGQSVIQLRQRA